MSERTKEQIQELLTLYSLGLLEGEELREVEELLRSKDTEALGYIQDVNTVFTQLAYSLEDKPLSTDVKRKILDEIENEKVALKVEKPGFADLLNMFWFKFSAVAVCLVIGFLTYSNIELRNELDTKSEKFALMEHELYHQTNFKSVFDGSNVKEVSLGNLESAIKMKLYLNSIKQKGVLCIVNIPGIGQDKTYQMWVESKNDMESIATFTSLDKADNFPMHVMIEQMPDSSAQMDIYVSVEPKGGMPRPTGKKYLLGKL